MNKTYFTKTQNKNVLVKSETPSFQRGFADSRDGNARLRCVVVLGELDCHMSPANGRGIAVGPGEDRLREERGLEDPFTVPLAPAVVEPPYGGHRRRLSGTDWSWVVVDDDLRHRLTGRPLRVSLNASSTDSRLRVLEALENPHLFLMSHAQLIHVVHERWVG